MDVDVTELIELEARKVSGVTHPANGTPFAVIKASADDDNTEDENEEETPAFDGAAKPFKAKKSADEPFAKDWASWDAAHAGRSDGDRKVEDKLVARRMKWGDNVSESHARNQLADIFHRHGGSDGNKDNVEHSLVHEGFKTPTSKFDHESVMKDSGDSDESDKILDMVTKHIEEMVAKNEGIGADGDTKRANVPAEDFAGPNRTFPITCQQDVTDAARLVGQAADPATVKAKIVTIAKRKGYKLPESWQKSASTPVMKDWAKWDTENRKFGAGQKPGHFIARKNGHSTYKMDDGRYALHSDATGKRVSTHDTPGQAQAAAEKLSAKKSAVQDALDGFSVPDPDSLGQFPSGTTLPWFTERMTGVASEGSQSIAGNPGIPGGAGLQGGESPYPIDDSGMSGPGVFNPGAYVKAKAASDLLGIMEEIEAARALLVVKGELPLPGDTLQIERDLRTALTEAARLSFELDAACKSEETDAAEGFAMESDVARVVKTYRHLKVSDEEALRKAHSALSDVLAQHDEATAPHPDKEMIHMDLTKEELAELVAKASTAALTQFVAKQDANNGGNISEEDLKPTSEHDANDLSAIDGSSTSEDGVTKAAFDAQAAEIAELKKQLEAVSRQPREGGPVLDGQVRGLTPAAEGRQGGFTKSELDGEIERLEKSLSETSDPRQRDFLGQELTHRKLVRLHEAGRL